MTSIEAAFAALMAEHDLTRIGIDLGNAGDPYWCATLHWEGFARGGNSCVMSHGNTPQEALQAALIEAKSKRLQDAPEVPALTLEQAA